MTEVTMNDISLSVFGKDFEQLDDLQKQKIQQLAGKLSNMT